MNLSGCYSLENKENLYQVLKPASASTHRTFGQDITNLILRPHDSDKIDSQDPQRLGYYAHEIFAYLHKVENNFQANFGYLKAQFEINESMRSILIDWVIEVHLKFKLMPETLFLTVNIIDRFCEAAIVSRHNYQLLAISALLIACKYEEITVPDIKSLSFISDHTYSQKEILAMEGSILRALHFNVTVTTPFRFLERYARLIHMDNLAFNLAHYTIELSLMDYKMLKYSPSQIAASSIYLTNKLYNNDSAWPQILIEESPYNDTDLRACAKELCLNLQGSRQSPFQALFKKFSLPRFCEVAKMVF
ncbi:unnamed protein product [Blepharisma stoltei]|uniref:Cyclin N-terminal domain-containing protein n=1 Tax=Blepharisma stoltei TaxID=1481888 RepID=A0AAU9K061_9CILI|nr:unnamed protein product [Blepharisma stoltei]